MAQPINGTVISLDDMFPDALSKGSSSVHKSGNYLWVCDDPETVDLGDTADQGKWLHRDYVFGSGFVYTWHHNGCGQPVNNALAIHNPNPFSITVTSTNNGVTAVNNLSDISGWTSYYSGATGTSITIGAYGYGMLFHQVVPTNYNFGFLGLTNVTDSGGNVASAVFYDLAWTADSSGAIEFADSKNPTFRRGKGTSFYNTFYFDPVTPMDGHGVQYTILGSVDFQGVFGTDDLVWITDPTKPSGLLEGGFGQQHHINMTVTNNTGTGGFFNIFIGHNGPATLFGFVNFNGVSITQDWLQGYKDVIQTSWLAHNASENISFFLAVPGMSETPVIIGARKA